MMHPDIDVIESAQVPRLGPYSQAIRVGDLFYTAGQPGMNPRTGEVAGGTFEAQARQAGAPSFRFQIPLGAVVAEDT